MRIRSSIYRLILLLQLSLAAAWGEEVFQKARAIAIGGDRGKALSLLEEQLREYPDDVDSRLVYGTILSWEGRYAEARKELQRILDKSPGYGDARMALVNVERWDSKWEEMEKIAAAGQEIDPKNASFQIAGARARYYLKRHADALKMLDAVLAREPKNREARSLRESIQNENRKWEVNADQYFSWFSDGRGEWREKRLALTRRTSFGSVSARLTGANAYGLSDQMVEVEAYPRIRPGTYGFASAGFSNRNILYPKYRLAGEIFQSLPHEMEASVGMRYFSFFGGFNLYTASISRYFRGNYMVTARTFQSWDQSGLSQSWQFMVRRYFSNPDKYFGVRYGIGAAPFEIRNLNEVMVLHSNTVMGDLNWRFRNGFSVKLLLGASDEERFQRKGLQQYFVNAGMYYRF